jgi:hypothetical protein
MELLNFDPEIWKRELKALQTQYDIYPDMEGKDITYRRSAILLSDLFTKLFKERLDFLIWDFYLLAREYNSYCNPLNGIEEEDELKFHSLYRGLPGYTNLELIRATKVALGLSLKTLDEVEDGINQEEMVNFFNFLYRHCRGGFLCIKRITGPRDEDFFFDIKNGFSNVSELILADKRKFGEKSNGVGLGYAFYHALLSTSVISFNTVSAIPYLFIDVDYPTEREEETLGKFKIWPSIKLKTSPRGWHFYWILKNPAKVSDAILIMRLQYTLAKMLGGDLSLNRFTIGIVARIPGLFNFGYSPPHYVTYETTSFEYDLGDFDRLPGLSIFDQVDFFKKVWKG